MAGIRFQVCDGIPDSYARAADHNVSFTHSLRATILHNLASRTCRPVSSACKAHGSHLALLGPVVANLLQAEHTGAKLLLACAASDGR